MERFVWLVEMPQQEELNCVSTTPGVQCVTTSGILRMLELCAGNLDCHSEVSYVMSRLSTMYLKGVTVKQLC